MTTDENKNTRYYVDQEGNYLGGFAGDTGVEHTNHVEVSEPPPHAAQKYDFQSQLWLPLPEEE